MLGVGLNWGGKEGGIREGSVGNVE